MDVSFDALDRLLRRAGAELDAAEFHGALCGGLCAPGRDVSALLDGVVEVVKVGERCGVRTALESLVQSILRQLRSGDMSFTPLLPEDTEPLPARTGALGEWCEGFIYGLGAGHIEEFDRLSDTVQEAIRDMVEIARVGVPPGGDEEDEMAYGELVEYLRVAVQLVHDEFHPPAAATEVSASPSLH